MNDDEGARREADQRTRHSANMTRDAASINRRLTRSMKARAGDVPFISPDVLREWEAAYREEAGTAIELADAIRAEIDSRNDA